MRSCRLPFAPRLAATAWLAVAAWVALAPGVAGAAMERAAAEPRQVMGDVSQRLFAVPVEHRTAIRTDPRAVFPLVDEIVLLHFDVDYATQLIIGQHWRSATTEQRQHFVDALYLAPLRTYGAALSDATADRLWILPFRSDPGTRQVTVPTEVTRTSGAVVPAGYRLHRTKAGWKALDVVIVGDSYVRNNRVGLDAENAAKGIEAEGLSAWSEQHRGH